MNISVTQLKKAKQDYDENGYAVFRQVLDSSLIKEASAHVEWLCKRYKNIRPEHLHHPLMRDDAFWVRLVTDCRLQHIASAFLGPDLACFTAHYICKPARDGHAVLWHQDGSYWNLNPQKALTLWVAIDSSNSANGCLRMIPGTHRLPLQPILKRHDVPNMLATSVGDEYIDESKLVEIHLEPGDVSIHHPNIIHGSKENRSNMRRCGLDIGYMPASTEISNENLYLNPIFVAGNVESGQRFRPWPNYDKSNTIPFDGFELWDKRALAHNLLHDHVTYTNESPVDMTNRMMKRIQDGTVKSGQVVL